MGVSWESVRREALAILGLATLPLSAVGCSADPRDERDGGRRGQVRELVEGTARPKKADPKPPRCPSGIANCRRVKGRVIYVERVDPDGGGDAHLVLASRHGITSPGLTIVDLEPRIRPARLPGPGDWVGVAGPVYRGSHGQRQIEATRLRVRKAALPRARNHGAAWSSLTSILPAGSVRVLARPFHPRIVAFACPLPADAALPIERKRARGCELARRLL